MVSVAAAHSPAPDFVVAVAPSGFTADRTQLWSNRAWLGHEGVAPRFVEPLSGHLTRMLVVAGEFGDTTTDPADVLPRVRQPLLAVFPEFDRSTPPGDSLVVFRDALRAGGNDAHWLHVLAGTNHTLQRSEDGFDEGRGAPVAEHAALVRSFVERLPTPGVRVDQPPRQPGVATAPAPPAWYEAIGLHLAALAVLAACPLVLAGAAIVRRLRGRRARHVRWLPGLTSLLTLGTTLAAVTFLGGLVLTAFRDVGPVALGRPVAWLVLQALAVASLGLGVGTVAAAVRGGHLRAEWPRLLPVLAGALAFGGLAAHWGLQLP